MDDGLAPVERLHAHERAFAKMNATLRERIRANMDEARKSWQPPHMRRYYVQVARLQNTMLRVNRRTIRDLAAEALMTPADAAASREMRLWMPRRRPPKPQPMAPLAVALAEPAPAPEPPPPVPDRVFVAKAEPVDGRTAKQGSLF